MAEARGFEVIRSIENLGFGRACNRGADALQDEGWVAFVNPDVSVTSEQLTSLVAGLDPGVVAVAPLLTDQHGLAQPDIFRRRRRAMADAVLWLGGARAHSWLFAAPAAAADAHGRWPVEVTSGGCLLVRSAAFEQAGRFPDRLFLNAEDIVLCERLGELGRIEVDLDTRVAHQKRGSSEGTPAVQFLAETARATSAAAAASYSAPAWMLVLLAVIVGFALRSPRYRSSASMTRKLVGVCWREGRAIRNGAPLTAGPVFVGDQ